MYCRECGKALREDSKFCFQCGAKVITELKNESTLFQPKKEAPKTSYKEIDDTTNEQIESYADKHNLRNRFLIMTISLIWLAVSAFIPVIEVDSTVKNCYLLDIYNIIGITGALDFTDDLIIAIAFMCIVSYIVGILLVIKYFVNLLKHSIEKEKVCNFSKYATIFLSVPTVVILMEKLINDLKVNELFESDDMLKFTLFGWITILVAIISIIVGCGCKEILNRDKYISNNENVCLLCKKRYYGTSCPICGSSLIVK